MRRITQKLSLILVALLALISPLTEFPAAAQQASTQVTLSSFYSEDFPQITAYLDVHDPGGNFIHGLKATDVQILEDNNPVQVDRLEELQPGVQFVVAIAPGSSFDIRDANGVSRFDYLRQGINAWNHAHETNDDLSLVKPWGSEIAHVDQAERILVGFSDYPARGSDAFPDLQILSRALELVSNPTPRPGMERAILFITGPQAAEGVVGLQSMAARASELGVRIYVWVLAAPEFFTQPDSAPLRAVSGQTGGQFFAFSGREDVPDLEEILAPLRDIYQLSYTSRLTTDGSHQALAQITLDAEPVNSNEITFEVTLLPPQPVFVSPPSYIQRAVPSEQSDAETDGTLVELLPVEQPLEVMISYPDGYVRPLVRTTLYVDGAVASERTTEPFDQFTWDLRGYGESGNHVLQVEAVDSLGLNGLSAEISVHIDVPPPERNILAALVRNKLLITGLVVVLAGAVLTLVLIMGGKIRPAYPAQVRKTNGSSTKMPATRPRRMDPVTQPVKIAPTPPPGETPKAHPSLKERLQALQQKKTAEAVAYLTPLAEAGEATIPAPQALDGEEVVLGRDPFQATVHLDDGSVDAVHAMMHWEDGSYQLVDNDSAAGTWVNYEEIGPQGVRLEHGDLIYLGRVGFRFNLKKPGRLRKPYVRPYDEPGS